MMCPCPYCSGTYQALPNATFYREKTTQTFQFCTKSLKKYMVVGIIDLIVLNYCITILYARIRWRFSIEIF